MTFEEMLQSGRVYAGLLQLEPAAPYTVASVIAVGLQQVNQPTLTFESNNLIPASVRYATRYEVEITPSFLDWLPWGYAIVLDNPAAGLLAVQRLPAMPEQTILVGERWTIRSALTYQENQYGVT